MTAPPPIKAVYIDWRDVNWDAPEATVKAAVDAGYNVLYLAFYLSNSATDMLLAWAGVSSTKRATTVAYAHARGAVVMLSAGGATETPYALNATQYGSVVAAYALKYNLDGVDFDLENLNGGCVVGDLDSSQVVSWIVTATLSARSVLGNWRLISHAPQAPYFGGAEGNSFTGSLSNLCYTAVHEQALTTINWYNVQFYNQGATCYLTYTTLFVASAADGACDGLGGTAVAELVTAGVPLDYIVVGKPITPSVAYGGYVSATELADILAIAASNGTTPAGVFTWDYQTAYAANWIATVAPV